jgi:hypothetical protein
VLLGRLTDTNRQLLSVLGRIARYRAGFSLSPFYYSWRRHRDPIPHFAFLKPSIAAISPGMLPHPPISRAGRANWPWGDFAA